MAPSVLRNRLKAWWEGYDGQEYDAWLAARSRHKTGHQKPELGRSARRKAGVRREAAWKQNRIDIANLVWGEGYCGPGGPQHVIDLVKLLGLTPEMSVLMIGGGLGGPARVLAKEFGCYVDAIEQSKELVVAGNEISLVAGLSKKAAIDHYDFGRCQAFKRKYDAAISTEALFTVENKPGVLKAVQMALKPCKLMVVTDYVLGDEVSTDDPEVQDWMDNEPIELFPIRNEAMITLIEQAQFNLRVKEDVSDSVRGQITKAWAGAGGLAQDLLDRGDEGRPLVDTLLREATHWSRRSSLISKHKVRVMRYLAERTWHD
jgi:2-polyprenyl-3-methyl-5-hydroxy-6-metoxy-1,4-benzoquinol methylase